MASNIKEFRASGITARLFELIERMPEPAKKKLLAQIGDQREYRRIPYMMEVAYETEGGSHSDFILDISPGGIFLETVRDFAIGQRLTMTMNFRGRDIPLTVTGYVAWQGANGVGIRFAFDSPDQKSEMEELVARLG